MAFWFYLRKGIVPQEIGVLQHAVMQEVLREKFNPNHDPSNGQFTSGSDDADGKDPDAIKPVYPIETALAALSGGEALGAVRSILGLTAQDAVSDSIPNAAQSIQDYLGGKPDRTITNPAGDVVLMRGDKKIRFDINNPHGYKPHFHIELQDTDGDWNDAGDKHMYFFGQGDG